MLQLHQMKERVPCAQHPPKECITSCPLHLTAEKNMQMLTDLLNLPDGYFEDMFFNASAEATFDMENDTLSFLHRTGRTSRCHYDKVPLAREN